MSSITADSNPDFNPHSPCGERRYLYGWRLSLSAISIHTPHAGSDCLPRQRKPMQNLFQSTLPMRGATGADPYHAGSLGISIHTPHAGSDSIDRIGTGVPADFNPHSPCGERPYNPIWMNDFTPFQSTLPMRGATWSHNENQDAMLQFQSTLPMRGATRI